MSFWSRVYAERRRVILPLLMAAVVNVAVFLLAVVPLQRAVASAEAAADTATLNLASAQQQQRQARDAAASRERADRELQRFYVEVLPRSFATAERTTNRWLQQAVRDSGLEYRGSNFAWEPLREGALSRASSTVTLRGRYPDIRRFLHAVETASEFVVVERVELAQPSSGGAAGMLDVALVVSTFFVTEPPPQ